MFIFLASSCLSNRTQEVWRTEWAREGSLAILPSRGLRLKQRAKSHTSPDILATSNDVEPIWRPSERAWHAAGHWQARKEVQVGGLSKKLGCEGGGFGQLQPTGEAGTQFADKAGHQPQGAQLRGARWTRRGTSLAQEAQHEPSSLTRDPHIPRTEVFINYLEASALGCGELNGSEPPPSRAPWPWPWTPRRQLLRPLHHGVRARALAAS